jgi:hypothetical protein
MFLTPYSISAKTFCSLQTTPPPTKDVMKGPKRKAEAQEVVDPTKKPPGVPKRFKSSYICYSIANQEKIKKELGTNARVTEVAKKVAESWKTLVPEERKIWDDAAKADKERYMAEKAAYKGPWQVTTHKRTKKDPSAPKRPMSAFLYFSQKYRPIVKEEQPDLKNTDVSRRLGELWRNAPEEERQIYIKREAGEREVYKKDIAQWREEHAEQEAARKKASALALAAERKRVAAAAKATKKGLKNKEKGKKVKKQKISEAPLPATEMPGGASSAYISQAARATANYMSAGDKNNGYSEQQQQRNTYQDSGRNNFQQGGGYNNQDGNAIQQDQYGSSGQDQYGSNQQDQYENDSGADFKNRAGYGSASNYNNLGGGLGSTLGANGYGSSLGANGLGVNSNFGNNGLGMSSLGGGGLGMSGLGAAGLGGASSLSALQASGLGGTGLGGYGSSSLGGGYGGGTTDLAGQYGQFGPGTSYGGGMDSASAAASLTGLGGYGSSFGGGGLGSAAGMYGGGLAGLGVAAGMNAQALNSYGLSGNSGLGQSQGGGLSGVNANAASGGGVYGMYGGKPE